jgi:hypothetical protein
MKKLLCLSIVALSLCLSAQAATATTPTQGDSLRNWFKIYIKDFKRIQGKTLLLTGRPAADVMLDGLQATGLQSGSTRFSSLPVDLQTTLGRLKTDLETLRDKIRNTQNRINDLVTHLNQASRTGTPPQLEPIQLLVSTCYAGLNDGELADKERTIITDTAARITATAGLDPIIVGRITTDVTAILSGVNATKVDVDLLKSDLVTIAGQVKSVP